MVAQLLRTDGRTDNRRTDMAKLIVAFRNIAIAPQNFVIFFCACSSYT